MGPSGLVMPGLEQLATITSQSVHQSIVYLLSNIIVTIRISLQAHEIAGQSGSELHSELPMVTDTLTTKSS